MQNKENKLHLVNLALMVISLIIAIKLPFELFLFAYAVFGPLHYLTEINWLNDKQFFIKEKKQIWILIALTGIISFPLFSALFLNYFKIENTYLNFITKSIRQFYGSIILIGLIIAVGLVFFRKLILTLLLVPFGVIMIFLFNKTEYFFLWIALLSSIIHVYFFTLTFMAYGVTKTGNKIGVSEVLLLLAAPLLIYYLPLNSDNYSLSGTTLVTFIESNFQNINLRLGKILGVINTVPGNDFIKSENGIKIQIFIAFAYLYHYLNWFSKVSIIGWAKNTSKGKMLFIILIWLCSIGLYCYDYRIGLSALFFLSLLHVILEFPLNILSIYGISSFIKRKLIYLTTTK